MRIIARTSERCLSRPSLWPLLFLSLALPLAGCAHQPKDALFNFSGKTVLVMKPASTEGIAIPGKGMLSASGRGASAGAAMGTEMGLRSIAVLTPFFTAAGAIGGSIYGAVAAEPKEQLQTSEALFTKVIADADIVGSVAAGTAAIAARNGYIVQQPIPQQAPREATTSSSSSTQDSFDTILEISDLSIAMVRGDEISAVRPKRKLVLQARARLLTAVDHMVLADNVIRSGPGSSRSLEAWSAENAKAFREELRDGCGTLAENIIAETFMLHRFPKKVNVQFPYVINVEVRGMPPSYPPLPDNFSWIHSSTTLQPEFRWQRFEGQQVSYDLKVWDATGRINDMRPGALVYQQEGLKENAHQLASPLIPSKVYFWSVRAHFTLEGKRRVTEWSQYRRAPGWLLGLMTFGIAYLIREDGSYYRFKTPDAPVLPANQ